MVFQIILTYFSVPNMSIGIHIAFNRFDGGIRDCDFVGVGVLSLLSSAGIGLTIAALFSTFVSTGNLCRYRLQATNIESLQMLYKANT